MGRHMKSMTLEEAQGNSRRVGKYTIPCRKCPKYARGFCSVFAKFVSGESPVCNYGKLALRSATQKKKWSVYAAKDNETSRKNGNRNASMMKNDTLQSQRGNNDEDRV